MLDPSESKVAHAYRDTRSDNLASWQNLQLRTAFGACHASTGLNEPRDLFLGLITRNKFLGAAWASEPARIPPLVGSKPVDGIHEPGLEQ